MKPIGYGKRSADTLLQPSASVMRHSTSLRNVLLAGALFLGACGWQTAAMSQTLKDIKKAEAPVALKSRGSFFLGGVSAAQTPTQLGSVLNAPQPAGGNVTVNQMYVEYMVPVVSTGLPVVMLHGGTVTGKTYDTTPDGRMGWYEYFVRRGHPVYVPDQVGRARSGADLSIYNDVRAGVKPPSALPNIFRLTDEIYWTNFRFGPAFGSAFPDSQFPVAATAELSKQAVPDLILLSSMSTQANQAPAPSPPGAPAAPAADSAHTVVIQRAGSQPSARGPETNFTGSVRVDGRFEASNPARVGGATVTFEPGARTAWHTHPLGQTLIVTAGVGWVEHWGGPIQEIRPGDVVWIPPGVKHWHGAMPTSGMTHIAISERLDGKSVDWMEKVSDEQYR